MRSRWCAGRTARSIPAPSGFGPAALWLLNDYVDSLSKDDRADDAALSAALERAERAEQELAALREGAGDADPAAALLLVSPEDLMAELGRRVAGAGAEEIAALNARAETAETKLAAITAALA